MAKQRDAGKNMGMFEKLIRKPPEKSQRPEHGNCPKAQRAERKRERKARSEMYRQRRRLGRRQPHVRKKGRTIGGSRRGRGR